MARVGRSAAVLCAFSVAFALSIVAGRATRLAGEEVALVWPAAAVAIIWLLVTHQYVQRERAVHLVALGLVTFVMNVVTGAAPVISGWFVLVNLVGALVAVWVLTYRRTEVVLRDPADLGRLVAAVTAGVCCAAVLATAFVVVDMGGPVWATFALFAVRNGASALIGVAIWLRLRDVTWRRPNLSASAVLETVLVAGGLTAIFLWIFWFNTGVPMAFLTLVAAAGIALRYSTAVSVTFLTVAGVWIIGATLLNRGVFVVPDFDTQALLAQAMVCSLTVIVLILSLFRDSRARLISQLEVARYQADQDSELLGAVLDNIHDSVVLVDSIGEVVLHNARAANDLALVRDLAASQARKPDGSTVAVTRNVLRDVVVDTESSRTIELTTAPLARQSPLHVMAFRDVTEERLNARALQEARDLFAGVLQAASEQAIIGTDPLGCITVFNHGAERLLGWTQSEMLGRTPLEFHLPAEVSARAAELGVPVGFDVFVHNVTPDTAEVREWTYVRRDDTHATVSLAVSRMTDDDGSCAGYIGVATDITEQKAAEQALAESEERFRLAFDTAPMGMFMFDVTPNGSGRITECNEAMAAILGQSTADVLGTAVARLGENRPAPIGGGLRRLLMLQIGQSFDAEVAFQRADGLTVWGAVSASVVAPRGSSPYGICLVEDITARKRVEAELQHLALHDRLTGLANRALFMDRVEHALAAAERDTHQVGVIFLDLDGFKAINDTFGHAQGDEVLVTVAQRILAAVRPRDTAARLGGDEFAVLCPQVADLAQLKAVAERIRAEVHRPIDLVMGGTYDQLSVSGGVATSQPGGTAEKLLQRADALMYHAKRSGKDCIALSETSEEAALLRAVTLVPELERAVSLNEFIVRFQPIVDLRTGECVAAEALLRWDHPTRGMLEPAEFLTVAETSRHMSAIGRYVLYESCRQAQQWSPPMEEAAIHVNVSGRQLEVGDFRADVLDALARTGLSPDRLVLELTETYAGRVANSAEADLEQLRRIGVRIAIDDVGTGFSGLAKIVDLPVDILKIDKQFIGGLPHDRRCEAITKAVLGLGSSLGLSVIAEGIESRVQRDLLAQWGCELGQGFLFGQAMDGAESLATRRWA